MGLGLGLGLGVWVWVWVWVRVRVIRFELLLAPHLLFLAPLLG